jgi:hypothetical protein
MIFTRLSGSSIQRTGTNSTFHPLFAAISRGAVRPGSGDRCAPQPRALAVVVDRLLDDGVDLGLERVHVDGDPAGGGPARH